MEAYWHLTRHADRDWDRLRYLLRMDRLCRDCIQHSDLVLASTGYPGTSRPDPSPRVDVLPVSTPRINTPSAPLEVIQTTNKTWNGCKFACPNESNRLHCSGCATQHSVRAFSKAQTEKSDGSRICIGREGVLRLCEHQHIKWSDIEAHFLRQHNPDNRSQLVPITCQLMCEHERRSTGNKHAPKYGFRPRLTVSGNSNMQYDIDWSWTIHHTLTLDTNGQLDKDEVRAMFEVDFRGVAGTIFTGTRNGDALKRAMSCFPASSCTCLNHTGVQQPPKDSEGYFQCLFEDCPPSQAGKKHASVLEYDSFAHGMLAERIEIDRCLGYFPWSDKGQTKRPCLTIRYSRKIGGRLGAKPELPYLAGLAHLDPIIPPHEWLHALDPTSYELNDNTTTVGNVWPVCRDISCGNHYARYQTTHCGDRRPSSAPRDWRY